MQSSLPRASRAASFVSIALAACPAFAAGRVDHLVAVAPRADATIATQPSFGAFSLPGVADDLVFTSGGQFVELPDGRARLVGVLASVGAPRKQLLADLTFDQRVAPGDAAYPPAGAPTLDFLPSAYFANGGTVDPSRWRYWLSLTGSFTGLEDLRGARLGVSERSPGFQLGFGANGLCLGPGALGLVRATTLAQPAAAPALPATIDGETRLELRTKFVSKAQDAVADPAVTSHVSSHGFYLDTLGADWRFVAGGELEETSDGTARMTGVIAHVAFPTRRFFVDATFGERTNPLEAGYAPPMSPKKELLDSAYVENGGPVDPNHWYYYEEFDGTLTGLNDFSGVRYAFTRAGPAFQIGVGANGKNLAWGGSGWLDLVLLAEPGGAGFPAALVGDINVDLGGDERECASRADALAGVGTLGGHALYLAGIGDDFVFQPGGQFAEHGDGTATLTGVVARTSDLTQRFLVSAAFSQRLDPNDRAYPPPMSPKLELDPSAYVQNGGAPIDPSAWHYYLAMHGTLIGQGAFTGAVLALDPMGPAFQVGLGANGKNLNYGASGWLTVVTQTQPNSGFQFPGQLAGDFNVDLGDDCPVCAERAVNDPAATYTAGAHAFYLPGIAPSFTLAPGARFVELDDGTARLTGTTYVERRPGLRFAVDLVFSARLDPGELGYAPPMSPKKELHAAMYVENGGPIDPSTWHYYRYTDGFLVGEALLDGAVLRVERMGPAFQVGLGASGKNAGFGASGWLDVRKLSNPTNGWNLPSSIAGDVNVDLREGCE